jgi:hypothetical protein
MPTAPANVEEYLEGLDEPRRSEVGRLHGFIRKVRPDLEPHLESGILGYGRYHYRYGSGREGDWFVVGLASRKQHITVYLTGGDEQGYLAESYGPRFPKAKTGKGCLYFRNLDAVEWDVLEEALREAGPPPQAR